MEKGHLSRRELLIAGVTAGALGMTRLPALAGIALKEEQAKMVMESVEPKLVRVPTDEDIQKAIKGTEHVGLSRRTHEEHLKLWQGYANKTNEIRKALADLDTDPAKANQIYSQTRALKVNYAFALGGYKNHNVYFDTLGGSGGAAKGDIEALINEAYGSMDKWAADWKSTGIAGRGWAYLGYDRDEQRVFNFIGDSQDTFPQWNCDLVLAMDVYEHAYYIDFGTARAKYIDAWLQVVDWDAVNRRLSAARGK